MTSPTPTPESGYHRSRYYISDETKADAAYAKLKTALETHNDRDKTVSVEMDTSEVTFRLGSIAGGLSAVGIEALNDRLEKVDQGSPRLGRTVREKASHPTLTGSIGNG